MILKNYGDRGGCNFFHIHMLLVCFFCSNFNLQSVYPSLPEYFRYNLGIH